VPAARFTALVWGSTALTLLAAGSFVLLVGDGWSWPLFVWGALLGPLSVLGAVATSVVATWYLRPTPAELERRDAARRDLIRPARVSGTLMGLPFGAIAASTGSAAPDVLLSVGLVVTTLLPLAILPALKRRSSHASDGAEPD
jgi:hypothetical protein